MQTLNKEEISNILNLINRVSNITGAEALAVAVVQQKLNDMLATINQIELVKAENPIEVSEEVLQDTIGAPTE